MPLHHHHNAIASLTTSWEAQQLAHLHSKFATAVRSITFLCQKLEQEEEELLEAQAQLRAAHDALGALGAEATHLQQSRRHAHAGATGGKHGDGDGEERQRRGSSRMTAARSNDYGAGPPPSSAAAAVAAASSSAAAAGSSSTTTTHVSASTDEPAEPTPAIITTAGSRRLAEPASRRLSLGATSSMMAATEEMYADLSPR